MQEALRTYLELAMGLTEASRKTVKKVVRDAVGKTGATAEQAKALTSELLTMNSANREALAKLVRFEVDRALGLVGLATADEVGELTARVQVLERALRDANLVAEPTRAASTRTAAKTAAGTKVTAAKATAPKATARKATATKATKATAAASAPAKKTVAKKTAKKASQ